MQKNISWGQGNAGRGVFLLLEGFAPWGETAADPWVGAKPADVLRNVPLARVTLMQSHPRLGNLGEFGDFFFLIFFFGCADSAQQTVSSLKYKQLEAEKATVSNSLNVFLENTAVLEQREETL